MVYHTADAITVSLQLIPAAILPYQRLIIHRAEEIDSHGGGCFLKKDYVVCPRCAIRRWARPGVLLRWASVWYKLYGHLPFY